MADSCARECKILSKEEALPRGHYKQKGEGRDLMHKQSEQPDGVHAMLTPLGTN